MSENRDPHNDSSDSETDEEWKSFMARRARRTQEKKSQATRKPDTGNPGDESKAVLNKNPEQESSEWEQCLHAARWIPRAYDMYCNLEEAIRVSMVVDEVEQNQDSDEDSAHNEAYKKVTTTLDITTILRHQRVYRYLQEHTPYLMDLIHKRKHQKRAVLIREMQGVINRTRSDDASHIRPVIGSYAAPHPEKKVIDPPVQPRGPRDRLGFNHPELARLLCPVRHLKEMMENPDQTRDKIVSGVIKVTAQKNPAFLYEGNIPGENFDPEDVASGFLRGYLLERIMKHIFTSPSSALSDAKASTRASNAKLHQMRDVNAHHIAYAATHARFSVCSQAKFVDDDGLFKLPDFYYRIAMFIAEEANADWTNDLYMHYNKLLFGNARGLGSAIDITDEPSDEDDIAIMKKQMAKRTVGSTPRLAAMEGTSVAHHNDLPDDGDISHEMYPTPASANEQMAGRAAGSSSHSRSSTAVGEGTSVASDAGANGLDNSSVNQGPDRACKLTAPVLSVNKSNQHRNDTRTTARTLTTNTIVPTSSASKGKSKAIEIEDDSPLTDVDEHVASTRKKRKKGKNASTGTVRKSTRACK